MEASFNCGCHLGHKSAQEHREFWAKYAGRRRKQIEKRQTKKVKGKRVQPKPSCQPRRTFFGTYHQYLESPQWAKKRRKAFKHYGKKCCRCGATGRLQIHHRHYRTLYRETVLDLEVLCGGCHENEHEGKVAGVTDPMTREFLAIAASF